MSIEMGPRFRRAPSWRDIPAQHCAPLGLGFVLFWIFVVRCFSLAKTRQERVYHEELSAALAAT
jgi:hypothetical protein